MLIPHEQLSHEALENLIEEFVTRDGTDYGFDEISLSEKTARVRQQLQQGDIVILFDQDMGSCNIVPRRELARYGIDAHNEE